MRSLFRYVLYAGLLVAGVIALWMISFVERIFQGDKVDGKTPNFIDTVDAAPRVNDEQAISLTPKTLRTRKAGKSVNFSEPKPTPSPEQVTEQDTVADKRAYYQTTASFGGYHGTRSNNYSTLDFLIPLNQHRDQLLFLDIRGVNRNNPIQEYNLGLGYRWLNADASELYGIYGFYDYKQSALKNWFHQLTLGGEWRSNAWSLGANMYVPIGTTKYETSRAAFADVVPHQGDKFIFRYGDNVSTEYALYGVDAEVGYTLPSLPDLTAYLGGFYFDHAKTKAIAGPRAGLSYNLAPLLGKSAAWIGELSVETSYQYDSVRKDVWYTGVRLSIPFGHKTERTHGLQNKMTAFVRRDLDVVSTSAKTKDFILHTNDNGDYYVGKIVTDAQGLTDATTGGSGIDLIAVKGQISVTGPDFIDEDTPAAVTLLPGQSITGLRHRVKVDGVTYHFDVLNSKNAVNGADSTLTTRGGLTLAGTNNEVGHLLAVYTEDGAVVDKTKTQLIADLILRVPEALPGEGQSSAAITTITGQLGVRGAKQAFGDVVIDNVDTNGIMSFWAAETQTGQLTIKNSQFNIINPRDGSGAIDISSDNDADLQLMAIYNNDISVTSDAGSALGMYIQWANGPVTYNRFNTISATGNARGIYVEEVLSGRIDNNTFKNITSTDGEATGIKVYDHDKAGITGTINNNIFGNIEASGNARGIDLGYHLTGEVSNNTFGTITSTGANAYGLYAYHDVIGSMNGNVIGAVTGYSNAYGIYVDDNVQAGATISNNVIGDISAITQNAYAVYIDNDFSGTLSGNVFGDVTSTEQKAYGVYVGENISAGALIDSNVFGNITGSGSVFGISIEADSFEGSLEGTVSNNMFGNLTSTGDEASGIYTFNINETGSIEYNIFNNISANGGWSAYGVYIEGDLLGQVDNNTFNNLVNTDGEVTGIAVSHDEGGPVTGTINNNVFGNIEASGSAAGIYLGGELIGEVSNNSLGTITSTGSSARGIYADYDVLGSMNGNIIADIVGNYSAYGIYVNGDVIAGATINNNVIGDISATRNDAQAVYIDGEFAGTLSSNIFVNITSTDLKAYGVYVDNDISAGALIDSNVFGNLTGLDSVFGINTETGGIAGTVTNNTFGNLISTGDTVSNISSATGITGIVDNNVFDEVIEE